MYLQILGDQSSACASWLVGFKCFKSLKSLILNNSNALHVDRFHTPRKIKHLMQWGMFLRGPSIIFNNIYMYLIINYSDDSQGLWVFHLYAVNGALYIKSPLNSIIQGTESTNKKKKRRSTSSQPSGIWRMYFNATVYSAPPQTSDVITKFICM